MARAMCRRSDTAAGGGQRVRRWRSATRATAIATCSETARSCETGGKSRPCAAARRGVRLAMRTAAAANIASVTCAMRHAVTASPTPGKLYALLHMLVRPVAPPGKCTSGNGEPDANNARPFVASNASCALHSARDEGFDSGIITGRTQCAATSDSTSRVKTPPTPASPMSTVGFTRRTTSSSGNPSGMSSRTYGRCPVSRACSARPAPSSPRSSVSQKLPRPSARASAAACRGACRCEAATARAIASHTPIPALPAPTHTTRSAGSCASATRISLPTSAHHA
mmetsp:Transcript_13330/g.35837  ORF Transcript_13330/g.35837 Transcript_13330/m.35837 type:complete len:283 (-) Transcript_13330:367-1215(-)